jgi:hypothetical protein
VSAFAAGPCQRLSPLFDKFDGRHAGMHILPTTRSQRIIIQIDI